MKSRSRSLADKSVEAMIAAIEVYNKPSFSYREESFAILAINAWELLLKARLLQLGSNKIAAILRYEKRRRADGTLTEKRYRAKSRSGACLSVGLFRAIDRLRDDFGDKVPSALRDNLELLCEVRDNAVHFMNKGFDLAKLVQEIGTASLKNYVALCRQWFGIDLSVYNFFLMPLAFIGGSASSQGVLVNADERKIVQYLTERVAQDPTEDEDDYGVAVRMSIKFTRSKNPDATQVVISNDPDATPVRLSEEDIRERYPWDYGILTTRLKRRYSDFKANQRYHEVRKPLEEDERFCNRRYLDPAKKLGVPKCFYNPNILVEFDKHYTRQSSQP